jgi:hypothetical protein
MELHMPIHEIFHGKHFQTKVGGSYNKTCLILIVVNPLKHKYIRVLTIEHLFSIFKLNVVEGIKLCNI